MNREFNPISILARALMATASLLASGLVVASIAGLADHYGADSHEVNIAQRAVVAQR
jgi:hypothetical protein